MISIKEAIEKDLDDGQQVEAIHIGMEELAYCTEENLQKLPLLKKISLHATGENNAWTIFPEPLLLNTIEELDIHGVRIPDFIELNLKKLTAVIPALDFPAIANNFPELEELTLNIDGSIVIDKAFSKLSKLKKLTLKFNKNSELLFDIDDLSTMSDMQSLKLRNVQDSVFSKQWCSLTSLKELVLLKFDNLTEFPQEAENLSSLELLKLTQVGAKEKDWNADDFFDDDEVISMPENISLLKGLKTFKSDSCAYESFEPLANLALLIEISIDSTQLKSIPDLSNLEKLETLNIPNSYGLRNIDGLQANRNLKILDISSSKVKTLEPISGLQCLESINIESTPLDENKYTVISALMALKFCKSLKKMQANNLSQQEWDVLDKGQYTKNLSKQEILSICKSVSENSTEIFEKACLNIFNLKDVFEGEIEEDADSGGRDEIPFFDEALKQHVQAFKDETLIHLIEISFADTSLMDSYELTIIVLKEAIRRKSVIVQDTMAKAFKRCHCYYDSGHRFFGSTVYDTLVDELFSELEQAPLARILLETDEQLLYSSQCYGDDVGNSFYSYFKKSTDKEMAVQVLSRYRDFVFEELSRLDDEEGVECIFERLKELDGHSVVSDELAELTNILSVYSRANMSEEISLTEVFIRELLLNKNSDCLISIVWENILEFEGDKKELEELDFDVCYDLLICYMGIYDTEGNTEDEARKAKERVEIFFTLLYIIDKEKLRKNILAGFKTSEIIKGISYDCGFELDEKAIILYMLCLVGELNGEDVEKIVAQEKEKDVLKEEQEKEKENEKSIKNYLKEAFDDAMDEVDRVDDFISCSLSSLEEISESETLAFEMPLYTTRLMIQYLQAGDFDVAQKVFHHYVDELLPRVGEHEKTSDVASNALVMSILTKNQDIFDKVFNDLLGGNNFDVTKLNNEILLFNLSCYYAINDNKAALLPIIEQALKQGKTPDQFMQDDDFSQYREDEDFLAVLKQ